MRAAELLLRRKAQARERAVLYEALSAPRRRWSCGGEMRTVEMPAASAAPAGARVIESRGPFAVALAAGGAYLGLFRKEAA
jgi:hypothetical protein